MVSLTHIRNILTPPKRIQQKVSALSRHSNLPSMARPKGKHHGEPYLVKSTILTISRYYFHMSNIETPDEDGGLSPETGVSFIVVPAKKGVQAACVRVEDPPEPTPETALADLSLNDQATDTGAWGNDEPAAPSGAWGGDQPAVEDNLPDGAW